MVRCKRELASPNPINCFKHNRLISFHVILKCETAYLLQVMGTCFFALVDAVPEPLGARSYDGHVRRDLLHLWSQNKLYVTEHPRLQELVEVIVKSAFWVGGKLCKN